MKMLKLFLIFAVYFKFSNQLSNLACYLPNKQTIAPFKTDTAWRLVWQDEFESKDLNNSEWSIEHEEEYCHGNYVGYKSCNTRHNVRIVNGSLVLEAKHEKHNEYNYTAARIFSKREFSYGRFEIGASQPIGRQMRTCFIVASGQIVMCSQQSKLYTATFYANNAGYQDRTSLFKDLSNNMHEFHKYAFEWNQNELIFFFDDKINSKPFKINATQVKNPQKISLHIGVGLDELGSPFPDTFEHLFWKCPNFIIDYFRYYERNFNDSVSNINLTNPTKFKESRNVFYYYYSIFGTIFILIIFACATGAIVIFLNFTKRQVAQHCNELTELSLNQKIKSFRFNARNESVNSEHNYEEFQIEDLLDIKQAQNDGDYTYIEMSEIVTHKKQIGSKRKQSKITRCKADFN